MSAILIGNSSLRPRTPATPEPGAPSRSGDSWDTGTWLERLVRALPADGEAHLRIARHLGREDFILRIADLEGGGFRGDSLEDLARAAYERLTAWQPPVGRTSKADPSTTAPKGHAAPAGNGCPICEGTRRDPLAPSELGTAGKCPACDGTGGPNDRRR